MLPVGSEAIPHSDWLRLQRIIASFETSWQRGDRPSIGDYLSDEEPRREALLVELVHAEFEFRLKAGESARVEDYLRKYPSLARDRQTVLGLIKAEWSFRSRRESNLALERFRERFPEFRGELSSSRSGDSTRNPTPKPSRSNTKPPSSPELPLPRLLGKFELRQKLGGGAFGIVYRAWDTVLKREVAVKVPRAESMSTPAEFQAFLREARNAIDLHHPNIVAIHDAGPIGDTVGLVRAFIDGATLAERLREQPFQPEEAANLMALVVEALEHAHRRGIIHRDLKPSNILLDLDGRPHVSDFGLAKRDASDTTLSASGQIGTVIGTPGYMSPEQARGEASLVDARSDVYSAGVVLYELLTGSLPFRGRGRMLQIQILELDPTPPRSLNDDIPHDLETICLKALAKRPDDRYQSAKEMAEDLGKFLDGDAIDTRPKPSPKPDLRPNPRRRPLLLAGLTALLLGLVGTSALWLRAETRRRRDVEGLAQTYQAMFDLTKSTSRPGPGEAEQPSAIRLRIWDELRRQVSLLEGDPALRECAADAYLRLADRDMAEGSDRAAGPHLERAVALCEALVREQPEQPAWRENLARALANLAALRAQAGDPIESRRLLERSLEVWTNLRAERMGREEQRHEDAGLRLDLAETEIGLAEVSKASGREPDLEGAERIALSLERHHSLDAVKTRRLARLFLDISRLRLGSRRPYNALTMAQIGQRLFLEIPPDAGTDAGLARATLAIARASRSSGSPNEAMTEFRKAALQFETLANTDPIEPEFRRQQGAALFELGQLRDRSGRRVEAILAFRESLRVRQQLHRLCADSHADLADLARTRAALAAAFERDGRPLPQAWNTLLAVINQARALTLAPGVESHRRELTGNARSLMRLFQALLSAPGRVRVAR